MSRDVDSPRGSAVLVLGMARSGTSAITRLLALLGMELGPPEALLPPAGENAKGFFEHRPIVQLNKELLERLGGSWSEPPRLVDGWELDGGLSDLRERARQLLASDFAGARLWGFKDPRTSLTLPFWIGLLDDQARYVICHRRPLDSARSLERRDAIRLDEGVALWTHYMSSALANTAGRRRIIVGYEELFGEREALVGELAAFLDVGEHGASAEVRTKVGGWIEEDLRHHSASLSELVEHPAVSAEAQALHLLLELAIAKRGGGGLDDALNDMARALLRHRAARAALAAQGLVEPDVADRGAIAGAGPAPERIIAPGGVPERTITPGGTRERTSAPGEERERTINDVDASIIVVLGDDPWGAMACLESLGDLERGSPRHEIVLVDNASVGLHTTLAALEGDVRVLHLAERLSTAGALREGVRAARGEIVVCLPAPAVLAENALSVLCGELLAEEPPAAVASIDPQGSSRHPAAALALAFRPASLSGAGTPDGLAAELLAVDVPDAQAIGALCLQLASRGPVVTCATAHVSPPPAPLCRRGPGIEPIELSVIVPTLDVTSAEVRECLRALQATIHVPHEIVVIDNGSPPQGFTAPVNAALRAARGRYVAVVNDDVRVLDGWWEPLADALNGGTPLVFPLTVEGRMRWEFAAWCFVMRRELLEAMSFSASEFFDPSMVVWSQDADLRKRMASAGLAAPLCVPEARIRHVGSRTVRIGGAPHSALRSWINTQLVRDTEIFRSRYPEDKSASERDGSTPGERDVLPPGSPALTPEHVERSLSEETISFRAEGPAWQGHTLAWPADTGHFFFTGEIEVQAADAVEDILVRAIFRGGVQQGGQGDGPAQVQEQEEQQQKQQREPEQKQEQQQEQEQELFWIDLVPGALRAGRGSFSIPRERARAIPTGTGAPPEWSQVRSVHLCARSRLRGALRRAPSAAAPTTARIEHLRLLALPEATAQRPAASTARSTRRSRLGIAVITYRRRDRFEPLMERLARFTESPHELVVAEDGGHDGTVEWCEQRGLRVITGENRGVARNKNRAIFALASLGCDPILIVEDDVYPDTPGWERDWMTATRRWHHLAYLHPRIAEFTVSGSGTPEDPYVNPKASAALLSISAQALAQVGYLDSRFIGWGHAHGEWTTRIKRAGYGFKPIVLPDGTKPKAQLYLVGGLVDNEGARWRDEESGRRNRALYKQIYPEPIFRAPWRSAQERAAFLAEQAKAGIDGAQLATELDAALAVAVG